ncbi:hypothetical membrane protein [Renibacterium salmoninarum ATCC 33209]|uniref:Hypothetical membrane protein n=1 Tax=Renibacterium salmoninarum (strain ATCC 33209 / DSM 20767 / JCM 11484 / NBRC 15589 / NCIMB 2235) TaxID=288705 RepID=A9WQU0_RENSM|nr:hypothetical membrane protein [Renibacterium salmoninarum ATCC 33209]
MALPPLMEKKLVEFSDPSSAVTQCAAVSTLLGAIRVPPQWPPLFALLTATMDRKSLMLALVPPTILGLGGALAEAVAVLVPANTRPSSTIPKRAALTLFCIVILHVEVWGLLAKTRALR